MSPKSSVDEGFEERWAAWQKRGAAHDRATRQRLSVIGAALILSLAILSAVGWL
jgi:hypothetical protein